MAIERLTIPEGIPVIDEDPNDVADRALVALSEHIQVLEPGEHPLFDTAELSSTLQVFGDGRGYNSIFNKVRGIPQQGTVLSERIDRILTLHRAADALGPLCLYDIVRWQPSIDPASIDQRTALQGTPYQMVTVY